MSSIPVHPSLMEVNDFQNFHHCSNRKIHPKNEKQAARDSIMIYISSSSAKCAFAVIGFLDMVTYFEGFTRERIRTNDNF